ncbi:LOB domain-containing protein 33-like [Malania oleifera]|uniref:LOB domain-containing protein 33-like n=1 Tax=Malania oleifera TaxID=397392 RepID=UPI0025AEA2E7|nr:LOB domain-containing protein 33-like [Malania oleifera]
MTGSGSSSCGACKFLRRKCANDCVFAPCFSYEQASSHFAAVHKVFGASNVSKLLLRLPVQSRREAAVTISYEALARIRDPIRGCVAHIFALQQQVANLQEEIGILGNHMANPALNVIANDVPNNEFQQFHMQDDCMHQHDIMHSNNNNNFRTGNNASVDLVFNSQTNPQLQLVPGHWENLTSVWDSDANPLGGVPGGIGNLDQAAEIFAQY